MHDITRLLAVTGLSLTASLASADFMDADWAAQACEAWNQNATLTEGLGGDTWAANNNDRGYKLIQIYRTGCGEDSKIQLNIESMEGKAHCAYGGAPDGKEFNKKYDYVMHASDADWTCMGSGKFGCGAMGAMMSGKLKFTGPKMEAMSVMDPFNAFLKLTGSVAGEKTECQ